MAAGTMLGEPPLAHPPELGVTPAAPPASGQHADAHHADRQSHRERPHSAMSPARENDASGAPTLCSIVHTGGFGHTDSASRSRCVLVDEGALPLILREVEPQVVS